MPPDQIENTNDQRAMATMVTRAFELWKLDTNTQLSLLGLPLNDMSALNNYRKGESRPDNPDLQERAGHLLAIHANLRLLFPQDRDLAYTWMTQHNRAIDDLRPVDVIRERGLPGLLAVRAYLDQARAN